MYPSHTEVKAPIYCFSATTHKTGLFFINEEIKRALLWNGECDLGFLVFDDAGRLLYNGVQRTTSGGEVNLRGLPSKEIVHIVLFRP